MEFKIANLKKPSNKKLKLIADIALYVLPFYLTAIMASGFSEEFKVWSNFGITIVVITLKAITKFTSEPEEGSLKK
jgi:hypothetical protein